MIEIVGDEKRNRNGNTSRLFLEGNINEEIQVGKDMRGLRKSQKSVQIKKINILKQVAQR